MSVSPDNNLRQQPSPAACRESHQFLLREQIEENAGWLESYAISTRQAARQAHIFGIRLYISQARLCLLEMIDDLKKLEAVTENLPASDRAANT